MQLHPGWPGHRDSGQGGFNLANRYWSNHFGQAEYITSPGVIGDLLIMYWGTRSTASSWSQVTLV